MDNILSLCLEVLTVLLQGCCLQFYLKNFFVCKFQKELCNFSVPVVYALLKLSIAFLLLDHGSSGVIMKLLFSFLVLTIITMSFYRTIPSTMFFLIFTFIAVSEICSYLVHIIAIIGDWLILLWNWCGEQGYISSTQIFTTLTAILSQVVLNIIFLLVFYFVLKQIVRNFVEKDYYFQRKELLFILTPSMVGLLMCFMLRTIMFVIENDIQILIYEKYPHFKLLIPAILLLSLFSIIYSVKLFQNMIDLNREKNSRVILEKQIESTQEHLKEMEHIYAGIRGLKHDMKNTLAVIMQLVSKNENTILQAYLSDMNQSFDRMDFEFKTGNTVVDILLNVKYNEILRVAPKIKLNTEALLFPNNLQIQSYDIGVILGNALDNAITACKKLKEENQSAELFIRLCSFQKGQMFFVEAENSFNGKIIQTSQSIFPLTDQQDKKTHGMGLLNIKNIAEKYQGAVDWSITNKIFVLTVMMKNERSKNNGYQ